MGNFPSYETDGVIPRLSERKFSVGDGLSTEFGAEKDTEDKVDFEDIDEVSETLDDNAIHANIEVVEREGMITIGNKETDVE